MVASIHRLDSSRTESDFFRIFPSHHRPTVLFVDHSFTNCFVLAFSKNETSRENKRNASTASAERRELMIINFLAFFRPYCNNVVLSDANHLEQLINGTKTGDKTLCK